MNDNALRMAAGLTLYVGTGILQPLLIDALRINGYLGRKGLLLPTLANTMGMACCGLLVERDDWHYFFRERLPRLRGNLLRRMIIWTAGVDLISGMLLTAGILQTGGAIFVILYNSCPMWTAFLSRVLLGKRLTWVQTMGVVIVCGGLVANVFGEAKSDDEQSKEEASKNTFTMGVFLGSIMVLVGSLLHSLMFVLSEMALSSSHQKNHNLDEVVEPQKDVGNSNSDRQISGPLWSSCLGTLEASVMSLWVLIGTGIGGFHDKSNDQEMTTSSLSSSSYGEALGGFIVLLLVDTLHAAAFFQLLQKLGALPSALLKGVQTVAVVGLSLLFFCPMELSSSSSSSSSSSTACLTPLRALSVVLVISGVILYGVGSSGERLDESNKKCMNGKETSGSGCNETMESSCCATLSSATKDGIGTGTVDQDTELKRLL